MRYCFLLTIVTVAALGCGGSGSETPPPIEPTSPTLSPAELPPAPTGSAPTAPRPADSAQD